jgi:hypothetical protein
MFANKNTCCPAGALNLQPLVSQARPRLGATKLATLAVQK